MRETSQGAQRSDRSVLMIVHSYCPNDPRVRREAEAIAERGDRVDVICLRDAGQRGKETIEGVTYWRLPLRRKRGGVARYMFEYAALFLGAVVLSIPLHVAHPYRLVQAHNMPDLLVFAGFFPWLCGASVLLDLHDPVPELYRAKFGLSSNALLIRILSGIERMAIGFADFAFAATGAFRMRLLERGRPADRVGVLLNCPDARLFHPRAATNGSGEGLRLLFHGTVTERSGIDLAIRAAERARSRGMNLRFLIVGDGDFLPQIRDAANEGDRSGWIEVRGAVALEKIPEMIAAADLGIIPNRPGPFHELALPTRLFEYLVMDRPVLIARSPAVSAIFPGDELLEFEPGDEEDLARAIERAGADPDLRRRSAVRGGKIAREHLWEKEKAIYLEVVDALLQPKR
jgi:glycosyltransferase involved in cell wall biosynthesis